MIPQYIVLAIIAAYTVCACFTDIKFGKLPNWLTVPTFVAGVLFYGITDGGSGLLFSLGGFAMGFGILFLLMAIGGGAAGDVKFMGAMGAWVGWRAMLYIFVGSGMIALAVLIGMMIWRTATNRTDQNDTTDGSEPRSLKNHGLRYAVPASISAWLVLGAMFVHKFMQ